MIDDMISKMIAFFMAAYLFIAGIPYGKEPVKIEFEYEIPSQVTVYEPGDHVSIGITLINVGRPFKGKKLLYHNVNEYMYQVIDGETVILKSNPGPFSTDVPLTAIIQHGYTEQMVFNFIIAEDAVPGIYSLQVSYGDCSQVFENVFEIKAKN